MSLQSESISVGTAGQHTAIGFPARFHLPQREIAQLEFRDAGESETVAVKTESPAEKDSETGMTEEAVADATAMQAEDIAELIDAATSKVRSESRKEWEGELSERVAAERSEVLRVCERFRTERERYFDDVEPEVVKLALAVAERILHREAKLDPLLLAAAVRIALEKVAEGSTAALRVPAADAVEWREVFGKAVESDVELIADDSLASGECVIETSVGKVDLGVSAQLAEIERGFFDLLQRRPE